MVLYCSFFVRILLPPTPRAWSRVKNGQSTANVSNILFYQIENQQYRLCVEILNFIEKKTVQSLKSCTIFKLVS
jgi:hypothetical protein